MMASFSLVGSNYDVVAIATETQTRSCYLRVVPTVTLPVLSLIAILNVKITLIHCWNKEVFANIMTIFSHLLFF